MEFTLSGLDDKIRNVKKDFSGTTPLFCLQDDVLFPGTLLPFYISEERDKTMIKDVESGPRLVCVTLLRPEEPAHLGCRDKDRSNVGKKYKANPPIHSVGTLCYLEALKKYVDGTFDILLLGLTKVLIQEVETDTPYRMGKLTFIDEKRGEGNIQSLKRKIFRQFGHLLEDPRFLSIADYVQDGFDFEMTVNMIATQILVEVEEKQKLLELDDLSIRAQVLLQFMDTEFRDLVDFGEIIHGDLRMN